MAGDTIVTIVGNLTADPDLKFTPAGLAVASFTVASTPRSFDKASGQWKDGDALFMRCTVWREVAEHVTESLVKGARVIVQGRLQQRSFETREGEKRTVVELEVDEVGPSLRYATATVNRAQRTGTQQRSAPASQEPPADPADQPAASTRAGAQGFLDEPPFHHDRSFDAPMF